MEYFETFMLMTISHPFVATYTLRVNRFGSRTLLIYHSGVTVTALPVFLNKYVFLPGAMAEAYPVVLQLNPLKTISRPSVVQYFGYIFYYANHDDKIDTFDYVKLTH